MAKFTVFQSNDPDKRLKINDNLYPIANFQGFDELGGQCTEATVAKDLGQRMTDSMEVVFKTMEPGTRKVVRGRVYELA